MHPGCCSAASRTARSASSFGNSRGGSHFSAGWELMPEELSQGCGSCSVGSLSSGQTRVLSAITQLLPASLHASIGHWTLHFLPQSRSGTARDLLPLPERRRTSRALAQLRRAPRHSLPEEGHDSTGRRKCLPADHYWGFAASNWRSRRDSKETHFTQRGEEESRLTATPDCRERRSHNIS